MTAAEAFELVRSIRRERIAINGRADHNRKQDDRADHSIYIIAELSANHHQDFSQAVRIIEEAKRAGADAVKLQTYTADTITIRSDKEYLSSGRGHTLGWAQPARFVRRGLHAMGVAAAIEAGRG